MLVGMAPTRNYAEHTFLAAPRNVPYLLRLQRAIAASTKKETQVAGINLKALCKAKRYGPKTQGWASVAYKEALRQTSDQDVALTFTGFVLSTMKNRGGGSYPYSGNLTFFEGRTESTILQWWTNVSAAMHFMKSKNTKFYHQAGTRFYELVLQASIGLRADTPGPIILDKLNEEGD